MGKRIKIKDKHIERESQKYEHPIPSREFILELLTEKGSPLGYRELTAVLGLETPEEREALRRRLKAMLRDGQLHQNRKGLYSPISKLELIPGRVIGHKDGFGFVAPDDGSDDLFLNPKQMRQVFHEDRVLVRVANIDHRGRREAMIIEVLERSTQELVGRLMSESGASFVEPSNSRISQEILIAPQHVHNATHGQMVIVKIIEQPSLSTRPTGEIKEILGDHMAPGMEIDVAIRNHNLPNEWSKDVLKEIKKFPSEVSEDAIVGRQDLRALPFVTIDGEDAKDFDDAVYAVKRPNGNWTLYVAIADVSYYVKPHSALDEEAMLRGNSVYFPGRVIPMLPEVLSNQLCSLNPHVNRLTMVCEMSITPTGKIARYRFYEAVIKSHARLTYDKVAMIDKGDEALQETYKDLLPQIRELFSLYRVLYKAREKRGTIDFDLPETKIIFGEGRKIERIVPTERNDAHRLIEECMLSANISASRFLLKNECPALYRVHEGPGPEKLNDLHRFLGELGLKLPGNKEEPTPRDYARLLSSVGDRPEAHLIQTVLLRSLSQAIYSPDNKGHFGLAYDAYTHFTSPIRRYPDLLVHRAIKRVLNREVKPGETNHHLEQMGEHCSMTERRADEATREAIDWLKCEFMMDKVGEKFPGLISGVTHFGFFVELAEIYAEGLVHISTLPDDYYHFNPIKHELYGERAGKKFRLGDKVNVLVARVDLDERKVDFVLTNV